MDLRHVKVVHRLRKVLEKLRMLTPQTDVAFDVLTECHQLGQQLLIDYLRVVLWQDQVLIGVAHAVYILLAIEVKQIPVDCVDLLLV